MIKDISAAVTGGIAGALANSATLWLCARSGLLKVVGIGFHPGMSPAWLYPRLFWGGIFGMLFVLPVLKAKLFQRGLLFGLVPSAVMFFMVLPNAGKGYFGLGYGPLMPVLVLLVNFIWGIVGAFWHKQAK